MYSIRAISDYSIIIGNPYLLIAEVGNKHCHYCKFFYSQVHDLETGVDYNSFSKKILMHYFDRRAFCEVLSQRLMPVKRIE